MGYQRVIAANIHIISKVQLREDFELTSDLLNLAVTPKIPGSNTQTITAVCGSEKVSSSLIRKIQGKIYKSMSEMSTLVSLQLKRTNLENVETSRRKLAKVTATVTKIMSERTWELDCRRQIKLRKIGSPYPL